MAASVWTKIYMSRVMLQNKLVPVKIPSHPLCIFPDFTSRAGGEKTASYDRETERHIGRSSVLQKGDILNSFISVSGSASAVASTQ